MIIDANASLGHWPFRHLQDSDADGFVRLMDAYAIAQAWVGSFEGIFYRDMGQANRMLAERAASHRDRLLPWATLNPAFPGWHHDLAVALDLGMVGVRLYPNYHGYELSDTCLTECLTAVAAASLPVAIYQRVADERLHHWRCMVPPVEMELGLEPLVDRFPDLPLLWVGGTTPAVVSLAEVVRQGRVYVDTSRLEGIECVARVVDAVGADRVLFGSHAPFFYLEAALLKLTEAGLDRSTRAALLHRNATDVLAGAG